MALLKFMKSAEKNESLYLLGRRTSHVAMFPVSVQQGRVSPTKEFHTSLYLKCDDPVQMQTKHAS